MTVIAALNRAYDTIPGLARLGYVKDKVSYVLRIDASGRPTGIPDDIREHKGKKSFPTAHLVPRKPGVTITSGICPDFLWGKASYVLGLSKVSELSNQEERAAKQAKFDIRAAKEHAAFKTHNCTILATATEPGLIAFKRFLEFWEPSMFDELDWPTDIRESSLVVAFDDGGTSRLLFELDEARNAWSRECAPSDANSGVCLATGVVGPAARLHPNVQGVRGAASMGASIASFNAAAFCSYGWSQGENATISVEAGFRYGMALNHFLSHNSGHSFIVGDTTVVFWAEASNSESAAAAVQIFGQVVRPFDQKAQSARVAAVLSKLGTGKRLQEIDPELAAGVKFYVLGLSPNVSRLVTRFFFSNSFGEIVNNYSQFLDDMTVNNQRPNDSLQVYLRKTATLGKDENVLPGLAGQWMRSILMASDYPSVLASSVLLRLRADGDVNLHRIQILKALLVRNFRKTVPMTLDREFQNKGYILGRLFAAYEQVQRRALPNAKATIKEKFFASAMTSPRRVFPALAKGAENHLTKIRRQSGDKLTGFFRKMIQDIAGALDPAMDPFPVRLSPEEQSFFALGYYQQSSFRKAETEIETTSEKE